MGPLFGAPEPSSQRKKELLGGVDTSMKTLSKMLEKSGTKYVAGDHLTLADLAMFTSTFWAYTIGSLDRDEHPRAAQWWQRVADHPSVSGLLSQHTKACSAWLSGKK